jgi:hypothetical protein
MFLTAPLPTSLPPCRVQTPPLAEPFEAQLGKVGGEAFEDGAARGSPCRSMLKKPRFEP